MANDAKAVKTGIKSYDFKGGKMMGQYPNAGEGIKKVFIGEILAVVGVLLSWIPLVGLLIIIAAYVLTLMGLKKAGEDQQDYNKAVTLILINIVVSVLGTILGFIPAIGGILSTLASIASTVITLLVVYQVIMTSNGLLDSIGAADISGKGKTVWGLYLVCNIIGIICSILNKIPLLNILSGIISIIVGIVSLVAGIMYLIYLNKTSKALGA
ncbi:MAG: hypothetical protein ACI4DW_01780 [Lachnospiraceae bacterium]